MNRVAYVSTDPGISVFGRKGASIHIQEMVRAFQARNFEVTLICVRHDGVPPDDLASINIRSLYLNTKSKAESRERELIALNKAVEAALTAAGPFDFIYERHALFATAATEFARSRGIPSVLEINAPLLDEQNAHRTLHLQQEAEAGTKSAFTSASHMIAVSTEVAGYARSWGGETNSVHVIPNAVNPDRFPERLPATGPYTVGFLGTLKPWHDVATLIESLPLLRRRVPDARLLIVGDGPERPRIERRLVELDLRNAVHFTGSVDAQDVPRWLSGMHVAVAPYPVDRPFYFSPLKIYEYMAAGLPVVASRVGDLDSVIEENVTGRMCLASDPGSLASVLADLAAAPALAVTLGRNARRHVLAHHTWNKVAEQVISLAGVSVGSITLRA